MKFLIPLSVLVVLAGCDSSNKSAVSDNPVSLAVSDDLVLRSDTTSGRPECTPDAEDGGDGWGFENGETCVWPGAVVPTPAAASAPECSADAINHGDGWVLKTVIPVVGVTQRLPLTAATLPVVRLLSDR